MEKSDLIEKADQIPHMGARNIKDWLIQCAENLKSGLNIVELGVWLGAGTAYLAIGNQEKNKIYAYDHFTANNSEIKKAKKFNLELEFKENTLSHVKNFLKDFSDKIIFNKCDIMDSKWNKKKIGILIVDVGKTIKPWLHVVENFLRYVVKGGIIILMDYWFFQKTKRKRHEAQYNFMKKHQNNFKYVMRNTTGSEALFVVLEKYEYEKGNK